MFLARSAASQAKLSFASVAARCSVCSTNVVTVRLWAVAVEVTLERRPSGTRTDRDPNRQLDFRAVTQCRRVRRGLVGPHASAGSVDCLRELRQAIDASGLGSLLAEILGKVDTDGRRSADTAPAAGREVSSGLSSQQRSAQWSWWAPVDAKSPCDAASSSGSDPGSTSSV